MKKSFFSSNASFFWGIVALVWQAIFFYIPLSFLVATSFVSFSPTLQSSYFTLEHYVQLFKPIYALIFFRSLALATSTVFITLIIAYPVAYYVALKVTRWKELFFALLVLPFWTNFLLLVYAWYFLLENDGLINSLLLHWGVISKPIYLMNSTFAVYIGMVYCYLPFMLLPLYSTLEKFNVKLLEASKDLGATYFQTFKRIILPLTWPGIRTGAVLVFVPAFGEFVVPALLGGDKNMYVGSVITHYFLTIRNVSLGSAFTCLSVAVLFFLLFMFFGIGRLIIQRRRAADV